MQFMYLRTRGTKKNPGRHPIGILGVNLVGTKLAIAVSTIHSSDKFQKKIARDLIQKKLHNDTVTTIDVVSSSLPQLFTLLPNKFGNRLDYTHHSKCFARLVEDELEENNPMSSEKVAGWTSISNSI